MLARHPEEHPEVKLIRRQTAAAKEILAREETTRNQTTTGPSKLYEDLQQTLVRQQTQLVVLRMRKEIIEKQLRHKRRGVEDIPLRRAAASHRLQRRLELETVRRQVRGKPRTRAD